MKLSCDYSELIAELIEEVESGTLSLDTEIQVLRGEPPAAALHFGKIAVTDYRPIIDWYYDVATEAENMDEYSDSDRQSYAEIQPQLEPLTVQAALAEMEEWGKLL